MITPLYRQLGPLTLPAGNFSPKNLSGLLAWYDASAASSVLNTSGVAAAEGDQVQQWLDLSGNNLHQTRWVSGQTITYRTDSVLGRKGVCWDTPAASMICPTTEGLLSNIAGPFTVFMVYRLTDTQTQQDPWSMGGLVGSNKPIIWHESISNSLSLRATTFGTPTSSYSGTAGYSDQQVHVVTCTAMPGGSGAVYVDSAQMGTLSTSSFAITFDYIALGFVRPDQPSSAQNRSLRSGAPIFEAIFCQGVLDDSSRIRTETYLRNKWTNTHTYVNQWSSSIASYGASPLPGEINALTNALSAVASFQDKIVYWLVPGSSGPAGGLLTAGTHPSDGCTVPLINKTGNVAAALGGTSGRSASYAPSVGIRWSQADNLIADNLALGNVFTGLTYGDSTVMMSFYRNQAGRGAFNVFTSANIFYWFGSGGGSNFTYRVTAGSSTGDTGVQIPNSGVADWSGVAIGRTGVTAGKDEFRLYPGFDGLNDIYTTTQHSTADLALAVGSGGQILNGITIGALVLRSIGIAHGLTAAEADTWAAAQKALDLFYGRI